MTVREKLEKLLVDLKKHESVISNNPNMADWPRLLEGMIAVQKISEEFGVPIPSHYCNTDWIDLDCHHAIGVYGGERKITFPDNGIQPQEYERLYRISFATGPYTLGADYPTQTFGAFFEELKTYQPKYVDSANHSLYFTADKAGAAYKAFPALLEKYKEQAEAEMKQKKREKLQAELAKLEE